ncbi:pyridoxal phosphate-dependent aminotransferase [Hippea jasoniae]|uniref:pyridoxal phosphate-dependent aminotransferase n=1 Tax=Hippea jasoniae TaxID=944479 RepID=UPI0005592FA9|nr:pyridoxal phosphate-dependent aminotransferase [Hippea jasoniae]
MFEAKDGRFSKFFNSIKPSGLRLAQTVFEKRAQKDKAEGKNAIEAVNVAIGSVSLKTHPKLLERYLNPKDELLINGIWRYGETPGTQKANDVFIKIIRAFLDDDNPVELYSIVQDGGSGAMRTAVLGLCGEAGSDDRPLLVMNPTYTNYKAVAEELGRKIVAVERYLDRSGNFNHVAVEEIERAVKKYKPGALLIIPYDNPSGQLMRQKTINEYARICLENNIFIISDEAYRGLYYVDEPPPSIWQITDKDLPGIEKAKIRISIESLSKTFNACGLRMGALVTDNEEFRDKASFANTTYLCPSIIDQHIVEALYDESKESIRSWISSLRDYYKGLLEYMYDEFKKLMPNAIVSKPEASIYMVVDLREIVGDDFDAEDFVMFCAKEGEVNINGKRYTLLVSPMWGFYNVIEGRNPGHTQVRIACVEPEDKMRLVPKLFKELLEQYLKSRR